jgi:hypothetical protein
VDYAAQDHIVNFNGYKDGIPFSQMVPFNVAAFSPSFTSVEAVRLYLAAIDNADAKPALLPMNIDLSRAGLLAVIQNAGKYVDVDLASCTMSGTEFDPGTGGPFDRIVSLTLPNRAKTIASGVMFSNWPDLKNVSAANITTIGSAAFEGSDALTTVNFPAVTSIGDRAFADCDALTTVNLPAVTSIGGRAFADCGTLTTVNLPAAGSIGDYAFADCDALTTVNFPAITSIGGDAFRDTGTQALTITLPKAAPSVDDSGGSSSTAYSKTVTIKRPSGSTGYGDPWQATFKGAFGGGATIIVKF